MPQAAGLDLLAETFAVVRLGPDAEIPGWIDGELQSVTRTADELSIVCSAASVPTAVSAQRGFRCLRVVGPLDFAATGILESLLRPLADAGVSVFVVSTYDTDYVLVRAACLEPAVAALCRAGHEVT